MWILTFIGLLIAIPIGIVLLLGIVGLIGSGAIILLHLFRVGLIAFGGGMCGFAVGMVLAGLLSVSGAPQSVSEGALYLGLIGGTGFGAFAGIMEVVEENK